MDITRALDRLEAHAMKSPMIPAVRDRTSNLDMAKQRLDALRTVPGRGLGNLQNYSNLAESAVIGAQKEFMAHVAEVNALKPPSDEYDDEEVPYEGDEEESLRLHNTFPTFVYSGTLIVAGEIFETHLTDLRKSLTKEFSLTVVDNPNQSPTFRAQKFLSTHFQVELEAHPDWNHILDFQQVRNCFAHSNGNVSLLSAEKRPVL